ncbi:MAG: TonB-dependent receptor [Acidobacteriia bacterium]|nr:TonB-dependent receptor [Terriglobia bacterium]
MSYAQSAATATIVGTVVDPQGAVVAGAKITATNLATGVDRSTVSTSNGEYTLTFLPPGSYDIKAEAKGFAVGQAKGVKLNVGDRRDLNFKLAVAGSAQTVEVTTEAPLIETTKTDVSSSVTDLDMQRLPTLAGAGNVANDYAQLALTAPGVKLDTSGLTTQELIGPGSINNRGNLYNVDGGNITDQLVSGRDGLGASVDEIQEFQVLTNNYNAEYGQAGGLILNAATKSGSNGIHGDGHMYFRGRNLGASNPFYNLGLIQNQDPRCPNIANNDVSGCPRAPFHRKEGGFTLGGPFVKDKLFWFASYELSRSSTPLTLTPPSGAVTLSQPVNNLLYSGKIDYHISSNHNLTIRYNVDRAISDNQVVQTSQSITPDSLVSTQNHNVGLNVGFVSSITPTLVNEARFVFTRFISSTPDKTNVPGQQHANFYTGANFCCPQGGLQKRYQYVDNLSWTHGKHTFKTGFNISYYPWFSLFPQFHFGQYGNFVGGLPTTFTTAFGPGQVTSKDNIYGFYGQDTWHVTKNFTVNYGLRWDYEAGAFKGGKITQPNGKCLQGNGLISACSSDKNNFQPRLGFTYAPWDKWLIKGSFAEVTQLAFNNVVLDSLNFDGTTLNTVTIKAGDIGGPAVLAAFPNIPSAAVLAPFAPSGNFFGRVRPIADNLRNPEIRMANFGIQHEFSKTLMVEAQYIGQFGFGLFGERDTNALVIVADPAHPGFFYFQNQAPKNPLDAIVARPDNRFAAVRTNQNSRTSHYNGLLLSVNKRMSNHVQVQASYTWSHALTSGEDFFGLSEPGDFHNIKPELGPAFNDIRHAANFGVTFDSGKWTDRSVVRWFTNDVLLGFVGQLQGGRPYPVSTSTTPYLSSRFFGAGNETQQRPNVLPDGTLSAFGVASADGLNANFGPGGVASCIAAGFPAAQCNALQNTFIAPGDADPSGPIDSLTGDVVDFQQINGNLKRDAGRGLPFYKVDMRLTKSFKIPRTEHVRLELEADAFNLFNHSNFQLNNTNDALSLLTLSLTAGNPATDFFSCTGCLRPNGTYVGLNGQALNLKDMQSGRTSKDLLHPNFFPQTPPGSLNLGGIGDPAFADFPRIFQLSFHVRF